MSRQNNMPFIKSEPDDFDSLNHGYSNMNNGFNYQSSYNGSVDPSELSMGGNFNQNYNFGGSNMSNSFMNGNGTIHDDELLESLGSPSDMSNMQQNGMSIPQGGMNGMYSNTPDGAPIQSPFVGHFDYSQFRPINSMPMSPPFMGKRPSMQAQHRKSSMEQRHAMTPRTAAMAGLHIGTPENGMQQNGRAIQGGRHQKTMSGQFDSTPNSLNSYLDSPLASPANMNHRAG